MSSTRLPLFLFFFFSISPFLVSCKSKTSISSEIDQLAFQWFGGTLFSTPQKLLMKELHLNRTRYSGKSVIVEGEIVEIGKHDTYTILKDKSGRILVSLTALDAYTDLDTSQKGAFPVKIIGQVKTAHIGFPYIRATALHVIKEP